MRKIDSKIISQWGTSMIDGGISVAISLYNYAHHIEECLDSVAAQDFPDIELIIVDDCSKADDSLMVAEQWMKHHRDRFPSAKLIGHNENSGLAAARNTAFHASSCDAVFVMDADNTILPSCIRKLSRALVSADADACYSQIVMFGDISNTGYADYWSKALLADGPYIDAMAMVRKIIWEKVGGYTHLDGGWEDYDFWCKLAEQDAKVCYVPEFLCRYRVHNTSMLRSDTINRYDSLKNQISLRHPWTKMQE